MFVDNNIEFPDMFFEDIATTPRLLYFANKIAVSSKALYPVGNEKQPSIYKYDAEYQKMNALQRFVNGSYFSYIPGKLLLRNHKAVISRLPDGGGSSLCRRSENGRTFNVDVLSEPCRQCILRMGAFPLVGAALYRHL